MALPVEQGPSSRKGKRATPLPRVRLDTIDRVRRELGLLYREGKHGRRDVAEVSKLANVLALIARIIEGSELERRIEVLEQGERSGR